MWVSVWGFGQQLLQEVPYSLGFLVELIKLLIANNSSDKLTPFFLFVNYLRAAYVFLHFVTFAVVRQNSFVQRCIKVVMILNWVLGVLIICDCICAERLADGIISIPQLNDLYF